MTLLEQLPTIVRAALVQMMVAAGRAQDAADVLKLEELDR